jgi:hypothetical protein
MRLNRAQAGHKSGGSAGEIREGFRVFNLETRESMLHVRRFATASDQMQLAIASGTNHRCDDGRHGELTIR